MTDAGSAQMQVEVTVSGLKGRILTSEPQDDFSSLVSTAASVEELPLNYGISREGLVSQPREYAAAAADLFRRFNVDLPLDLLRGIQSKMGR